MLYDLSKQIDQERAKRKFDDHLKNGVVIELTKKEQRTPRQNNYAHLLFGFYGIETGNTLDYVKEQYFKRLCNPDIFVSYKDDPLIGRVEIIKSTAKCTTEEISTALTRFKNWSASECGITLPDAVDLKWLMEIQIEMDRHKEYL